MIKTMPVVSVVLPSYNHGVFVRKAIDSVIAQSFSQWELIVVDDCSSDDSLEVLSSYNDSRINVTQNESNIGTYGTLHRACEMASGTYIAVINSDDFWEDEKLERQVNLLQSNPNISFSYTAGKSIGLTNRKESVESNPYELKDGCQDILPYLVEENHILASSLIYRRDMAEFNASLRYTGDWDILLQLAQKSEGGYVKECLTYWRLHDQNSYIKTESVFVEEVALRSRILKRFYNQTLDQVLSFHLGRCALHLSALYVLGGNVKKARETIAIATQLNPGDSIISKRRSLLKLPLFVSQKRLWPGYPYARFKSLLVEYETQQNDCSGIAKIF